MRLACAIFFCVVAATAFAQPNLEAHRAKLLQFLHGEYTRLLASDDWVTRALAVISLSRLPNPHSTAAILDSLEKDKHPVVRMLAWQATLSRASLLEPADHSRWIEATFSMKQHFAGPLRISLARALAATKPDKPAKDVFLTLFDTIKTDTPENQPIFEELGQTLLAWRSPDLVNILIGRTARAADAPRVAAVLKPVGFNGPARLGVPVFRKWWDGQREKWIERAT
jgi:hypothetical protein